MKEPRDTFGPLASLAVSAKVPGCCEKPLIFREEENHVLQTRALKIKKRPRSPVAWSPD